MKVKVKLSIGFPTACLTDVLEVDQYDYDACETEEQKQELIDEYVNEWTWNYIEISQEILEN